MGPAQRAAASGRWFVPVWQRLRGGRKGLSGHARLSADPSYQRMLAAEPILKRLIPVLIVIFLCIVAATRYVQLVEMRNDQERFAQQQIAMLAALVGQSLTTGETALPQDGFEAAVQATIADLVPPGALADGRRVIITDRNGAVAAHLPLSDATIIGGRLVAQVQPLLDSGNGTGTTEVRLDDGSAAFASARALPGRLGTVVVVAPLDAIMQEWRGEVSLNVSIFVGTSAILLIILYGYFAQATRANEADRIYDETNFRLDAALARGRCGLWDWDLASGRMFWSKSMFEILGMTPRDELLGFGEANRLVHPEDGDLMSLAEHLYDTGTTSVDRMFRMRHADGRWVWLRARAELSGETGDPHLIGIAVDTTELIRQAERNKTADIRLRDAIETISEAFVLWDSENKLVMCNSKYQTLYGLPDAAVQRGTAYDEVMRAGRKPVVRAQIPADDRPEEGSQSFEALLEDGRWLQVNERATKDGGFVSVGTDITQLKRHEERLVEGQRLHMATIADLRQSRQWLEQQAQQVVELADNLAEEKENALKASNVKSEFLANISHELRTPLNAIIGFSEIMQSGLFGPLGSEKYGEYCRDIHESGTYLLGVINDILDMSRIEAGRVPLAVETLAIDQLVEESIRVVSGQANRQNLNLKAEIEPGLRLDGDRRSIKQILLNLLSNAVKFTPDGGCITVRARRIGNDNARISIKDTGIGIPKSAIGKLGTPFEQVQNQFTKSHKGSGLGLAITRSLAELHGGSLHIRSREGSGTVVSVRLPAAEPGPDAVGPE
ncbi:MAG: PAS-domain containing protein [Bauldia sp.]|nr:PAS-domain containing protein [Bauldia sp.]